MQALSAAQGHPGVVVLHDVWFEQQTAETEAVFFKVGSEATRPPQHWALQRPCCCCCQLLMPNPDVKLCPLGTLSGLAAWQ